MPKKINFPIIGIGASAGGLEPLETFFENVSLKSGYAYVVIQHLAPNHKSLMDELLARHTQLPIQVIEDQMSIQKNRIYLNPPKKFVEIFEGKFILSEKEDRKLSFPISTFFESLANQDIESMAGIIISGTGSDGTEGIKYLKEKGGFVLAQRPDSAKFNGMPKNAIMTGAVDVVCDVEEMPDELKNFLSNRTIMQTNIADGNLDTKKLDAVLHEVKMNTGVDFSEYKITTILRRVNRRIGILGYEGFEEYLSYITTNTEESFKLAKELLIGVTRFFRDIKAFEYLEENVIPKVVESNKENRQIRLWIPACSTGEEAYSFAILIKDYLRRNQLSYEVTIFATDLDKEAIKKATQKTYPESIANEVPDHFLKQYFTVQKNGYQIAKEIRSTVIFSVHNLIQDPPFSKIDILSCRNFLIYVNNDLQQNLFRLFQYSLKKDAYLFLGSSESLGEASSEYQEVSSKYKIYQNKNSKKIINFNRRKPITLSYSDKSKPERTHIQQFESPLQNKRRIVNEVQHYLIQSYVPNTIVFNEQFELIHTTGNVNQWLRLPAGEIDFNLLSMLPEQLQLSFELLANKVIKTDKSFQLKNFETNAHLQMFLSELIDIEISPLPKRSANHLYAATFKASHPKEVNRESSDYELDLSHASKEKISILERELRTNKENLQTTIEELESSNEELQAANEELQSSNEELESVNEELYTVNSEFQQKVEELTDANDDLNNLIHSTDIAILFLDENLHIRRFTPAIKKILNLVKHDIGRHISHFRSKFDVNDLMYQIEEVYDKLIPYETTVKDLNNQKYLLQISPFKTKEKQIKGIVLSFIDITQISGVRKELDIKTSQYKDVNKELAYQAKLFNLLTDNANDLICLHDLKDHSFNFISPSATQITGYSIKYLKRKKLLNFVPKINHQKALLKAINSLKKKKSILNIRYQFKAKGNKLLWFETNLKYIYDKNTNTEKYLSTTRDITHFKNYNLQLKKLSFIAEQTENAVLITNIEGEITYANNAFEKLTGFNEEEVLGKIPGKLLQGDESDQNIIAVMREAIKEIKPFNVQLINYTKNKEKYWISIQCEPMFDENEEHIGFFSIQKDVTKQIDFENKIYKLTKQLKEQNENLEAVNSSLDEFAYVASHDLKAPLQNILGITDLLQMQADQLSSKDQKQYFDMLHKAADELSRLVDSLLQYSRSGTLNEDLEQVSLKPFFEEIKNIFSKQIKEVEGKIEFETEIEKVKAYPILLKRLFTNLIQNAIKYRSEEKLQIHISIRKENNQNYIHIQDNGIGIDSKYQKNIFKIFSTVKPNKDSNGIGLSVCKKIAELHKGSIKVKSELGKGSTFIIRIPEL